MSDNAKLTESAIPSASMREFIRRTAADLAEAELIPPERFPGHKGIYCANLAGVLGSHTLYLLNALEVVEAERDRLREAAKR